VLWAEGESVCVAGGRSGFRVRALRFRVEGRGSRVGGWGLRARG